VALLAAGLGVFLIAGGDDDTRGAAFNPTRAETETPAAEETGGPSPENSPEATPAPGNEIRFQLFAWSRGQSSWVADTLDEAGTYREGEAVPLLIRLEGVAEGSVHELTLRYECGTEAGALIDYVTQVGEADAGALATERAPSQTRPDSTIPIPDDPSIPFDDSVQRRFQLWGASFGKTPEGPDPASECDGTKEFVLSVTALQPAVSLIIAAHLAASADWGEGVGAAAHDAPLVAEAIVDGGPSARVEIADGMVTP
jgi:hypothetical protein